MNLCGLDTIGGAAAIIGMLGICAIFSSLSIMPEVKKEYRGKELKFLYSFNIIFCVGAITFLLAQIFPNQKMSLLVVSFLFAIICLLGLLILFISLIDISTFFLWPLEELKMYYFQKCLIKFKDLIRKILGRKSSFLLSSSV